VKNHRLLSTFAVAALAATMSSCKDSNNPETNLLPDATVEADVVASAGDAIALAIGTMAGNEDAGGSAGSGGPTANFGGSSEVSITRAFVCLDENGTVVANCDPFSSVRKIAAHVTIDGSRSGSNDAGTKSWSGAVHRVWDDTVTRVFNGPTETSRMHGGVNTGNDTTMFTEGANSRNAVEAAIDSVNAITWNLPRNSNPWPVSGSFVRRVNAKVTATKDGVTQTREVNLRIQVTFPADAQGNVDLTINAKTCNLNLVTGAVTDCT
jgi:hypothetical protein